MQQLICFLKYNSERATLSTPVMHALCPHYGAQTLAQPAPLSAWLCWPSSPSLTTPLLPTILPHLWYLCAWLCSWLLTSCPLLTDFYLPFGPRLRTSLRGVLLTSRAWARRPLCSLGTLAHSGLQHLKCCVSSSASASAFPSRWSAAPGQGQCLACSSSPGPTQALSSTVSWQRICYWVDAKIIQWTFLKNVQIRMREKSGNSTTFQP